MQVALHAGAHFTDDGQLVKGLRGNPTLISENGSAFWGGRLFRKIFAATMNAPADARVDASTREHFLSSIPEGRTIERGVLSNDSIIGEVTSIIDDGQLYPLAGHRIAVLRRILDGMDLELFVALQNLGNFIPKVLTLLPERDRQNILGTTDLSCLSWLTMIEDIRELSPDIKITLWCNEDTPLIWGDVLRAVAGVPEDTPLTDEYALLSSLLSDIGKHQLQKLLEQEPLPRSEAFYDALVSIFQQYALPDEIEEEIEFPGWSDEIVDAFTELYEQDVARLQTMADIRFLKP